MTNQFLHQMAGKRSFILRSAFVVFLTLLIPLLTKSQQTVYWRSEAANQYWANDDASGINNWYRTNDGWSVRRADLAYNVWSATGTKSYNEVIFDNTSYPTTTVNGDIGGTKYHIYQLKFQNSTNRTINVSSGAYFAMGGGSGNAKIEAVSGSGTGTYTINVPITYEKDTELNPVGGNITISSNITNGGYKTLVWGNNVKTLTLSGVLSGTGGLEIKQNSIVKITSNSTYSGNTIVEAGTLELEGSIANSAVTVKNGATLKITGSGIIVAALTIESGGTCLIEAGKALTVTGTLSNSGTLTLKSDATGTGSLIHSTSGVSGTVERYVAGDWTAADAGWHLISSPVASQAISSFTTSGSGNDYDFYGWKESDKLWLNYKAGDFSTWNGGTDFVVGRGYLISYESTQTGKSFAGNLNVSDVTWSNLSYTPTQGNGWHLLGNPFASALKWNDGNWSLSNVAGTAKIWNSTSKSYTDIAANGIIPITQGFMVQVNSATNSLTIPAASRVHDATNWYKSSDVPSLKLIARPADNSSAQEFKLRIEPEATMGYDFYNDSQFLPGYAPQIYAMVEGEKLSTSAVPALDEGMEISLGFRKTSTDAFVIELAENTLPAVVYLKDLKTGLTHNFTQNPVYSFTSAEGDVENRFKLGFASVGIEPREKPAPVIYAVNNVLYLRHLGPKVRVEIYTPAGQLVQRLQTEARELPLELATGIYLVKVNDGNQMKVEKIFIR